MLEQENMRHVSQRLNLARFTVVGVMTMRESFSNVVIEIHANLQVLFLWLGSGQILLGHARLPLCDMEISCAAPF